MRDIEKTLQETKEQLDSMGNSRNGDQCPYSIQFCEREESEAFSRRDPDSDPQRSDAGAGHVLYHGRRF